MSAPARVFDSLRPQIHSRNERVRGILHSFTCSSSDVWRTSRSGLIWARKKSRKGRKKTLRPDIRLHDRWSAICLTFLLPNTYIYGVRSLTEAILDRKTRNVCGKIRKNEFNVLMEILARKFLPPFDMFDGQNNHPRKMEEKGFGSMCSGSKYMAAGRCVMEERSQESVSLSRHPSLKSIISYGKKSDPRLAKRITFHSDQDWYIILALHIQERMEICLKRLL